jgi:hypothetical protein
MKTSMNLKNIKNFVFTFPSLLFFSFSLLLYMDSKIIIKNKYEETNNKLYLILLFIVMILHRNYR